eukprot:TRINITY_DN1104_c0_g1_i2.p1 TRINITY_DN1104_c0_g1~~TRINITY_DN1104_c0_g1_i2.p1  ORF type:complete len:494 (+),score=136.23 TRINITY_DN1104_c0_g1_i2:196-1482(+)
MSVGEVVLFNGLQRMVVEPDFLKSTPRLQAFHDRMESVGPIKEMLTSGGSMPRAFGPLWFKRRGVEQLGALPPPPLLPAVRRSGPMRLCYFNIMARGLAPALCLQVSGLEWEGEYPSVDGKPSFDAWPAMKNTKAFWQLPVLDAPGVGQIAHQTAIVNFVARKSPKELEGLTEADYITSQQLLQETEDMIPKAVRRLANVVFGEPKCTGEETEQFWAEELPVHLRNLEATMKRRNVGGDRFTSGGMTVGELAIFGFFHQLLHVRADTLNGFPGLRSLYDRVLRDSRVAKLLDGGAGFSSELRLFFVPRQQKEAETPLDFLYFSVIGRGFPAALCLEVSGLKYRGRFPGSDGVPEWGDLKGEQPFGSVPVLTMPGYGKVGHSYAICQAVARMAPEKFPIADDAEFARSEMLISTTDDMMRLMFRMTSCG